MRDVAVENRNSQLLAILRIGHDTSVRGAGLALRRAIDRSCYEVLRPGFDAGDLLPLIRNDGQLVDQWLAYSEDKRTTDGWWLLRDGTIGMASEPSRLLHFRSIEQAVAEYVVRELDFWVSLPRGD